MKIDSTYKPATSAISPKPATTQSSMPTAAQDEVSLSKLAGTLQSGEHPPINMARIQEIKQAISEGRFKINPAYLFEVKKPEESKGPWDYYKLVSTIPAEEAFRPLAESECPLVKK